MLLPRRQTRPPRTNRQRNPPQTTSHWLQDRMKGPTGEERTAPTSSTRVLGARSGQSSPSWPENRGSERDGALRQSSSARDSCSGPESRVSSPGPGRQGTGDRRQGRTNSPWRVARSLQGSGWSLCSRTLAGPSPGGGGGTQAAAAAALAPRSLSPAPPRACYINRRGTMSPNFVVGI